MKDKEYKGYKIADGGFQSREIKSVGAGVLPKALRGRYNSTAQAMYAIDTYGKGAKKNGKAVSNG